MTREQPRYYIDGVLVIPAREAHALARLVQLDQLRRAIPREKQPHLYEVLLSWRYAELAYEEVVSQPRRKAASSAPDPAPERETVPPWTELKNSVQAAVQLEMSKRRVNQLVLEKRLPAERIQGRNYFDPQDLDDYRKRA